MGNIRKVNKSPSWKLQSRVLGLIGTVARFLQYIRDQDHNIPTTTEQESNPDNLLNMENTLPYNYNTCHKPQSRLLSAQYAEHKYSIILKSSTSY